MRPLSGVIVKTSTPGKFEKQMIEVTVTIDFGPTGRRPFEALVTVPDKSTVLDVLLNRLPVTTSPRYGMEHFVEEIDGVKNDLASDRGWRFTPGVGGEEYAEMALRWRAEGAQIVGGCCGVRPEHIAATAQRLRDTVPGHERPTDGPSRSDSDHRPYHHGTLRRLSHLAPSVRISLPWNSIKPT